MCPGTARITGTLAASWFICGNARVNNTGWDQGNFQSRCGTERTIMKQETYDGISASSHLLDDDMCGQIRRVLDRLLQDVWVRAVIDLSDKKGMEMAEFLKAFSSLNPKVHLQLYQPGECPGLEEELACEQLYPVTGLYLAETEFTGLSFRGIPGGKEINAFVIAFYNAAGAGQPLEEQVKIRIAALSQPHRLQVFVSLACHYCAETVILCQHVAALSHQIQVQMTDAGLYPSLVEKYGLERVPVIVRDDGQSLTGGKSMGEILDFMEK